MVLYITQTATQAKAITAGFTLQAGQSAKCERVLTWYVAYVKVENYSGTKKSTTSQYYSMPGAFSLKVTIS